MLVPIKDGVSAEGCDTIFWPTSCAGTTYHDSVISSPVGGCRSTS